MKKIERPKKLTVLISFEEATMLEQLAQADGLSISAKVRDMIRTTKHLKRTKP